MAKVATRTAESTGGATDRLSVPGWYHMSVVEADVNDDKGLPIDGFRVEFAALDGPNANKTFKMTFFNPSLKQKEEAQKWSSRKQTAFLVATGLMTESQLASDVEWDTEDVKGRQVVMHLQEDDREENKGKGYLQLAYSDIFHVDDPRVAEKKVTLNAAAIKYLPPAQRRDPKSFDLEKLTGRKGGGSNGSNGNGSSHKQQPVGAGAGVDISDL
jgi:hypothetical protein